MKSAPDSAFFIQRSEKSHMRDFFALSEQRTL